MRPDLIREPDGVGGRSSASAPPPPRGIAAAFDPYRSTPSASADHGARHAAWTIATMLRGPVRDVIALAERPLKALMVGSREAWLVPQLLSWGIERVRVEDDDSLRRERVRSWVDQLAIDPERVTLASGGRKVGDPYDFALLDCRAGMPGASALTRVAQETMTAAALTDQAPATWAAASAAGLEGLVHLEPPPDSERRLIRFEWTIFLHGGTSAR